jgi:hypothetical protein
MIIEGNVLEPASINFSANYKRLYLDNFVYIPILKNAHRYTSTILAAYNFQLDYNISLENKDIIVVLRDPIERWFAGVAQFLNWHVPNLDINEETMKLLTNIIVLDGHTRSQTKFLVGVDTENCVFFNCDQPNFEEKLHDYCRRYLGGIVDMNNLYNRAESYNSTGDVYINFKTLLKEICHPHFFSKLKKYYEEDYKLLESVKFYRG